ncbi:uncharacterized protein BDV17DRAFT_156681 [Aspergillus undulatus]|uniref:uncharacterized protein n=1 Tax=Aspergillus undulatus TaxID=1810928 RepID=UPI003CCE1D7B
MLADCGWRGESEGTRGEGTEGGAARAKQHPVRFLRGKPTLRLSSTTQLKASQLLSFQVHHVLSASISRSAPRTSQSTLFSTQLSIPQVLSRFSISCPSPALSRRSRSTVGVRPLKRTTTPAVGVDRAGQRCPSSQAQQHCLALAANAAHSPPCRLHSQSNLRVRESRIQPFRV